MGLNQDEEIPVTSSINLHSMAENTGFTKDEEEESMLRRVHRILGDSLAGLGKWDAFDLTESELKLKQQIKAHKIAYDILSPSYDAVTQALSTIDAKYKERGK